MAGSGGDASLAGDALVLASAVLGAALIVVQGGLLEGRDPVAVTAVQMAAAGVFSLLAALPAPLPVGPPTPEQAIALGALVSVGSLIPFALYAYGQARVHAELAGAFVNLEPVVGVASGVLAFGNPFGVAAGARRHPRDRRAGAQRWRIRAPRSGIFPERGPSSSCASPRTA